MPRPLPHMDLSQLIDRLQQFLPQTVRDGTVLVVLLEQLSVSRDLHEVDRAASAAW